MESSPVWVPDGSAPVCMHCSKSEFTVFNRRVRVISLTDFKTKMLKEMISKLLETIVKQMLLIDLNLDRGECLVI
jgi:hypothetical protein